MCHSNFPVQNNTPMAESKNNTTMAEGKNSLRKKLWEPLVALFRKHKKGKKKQSKNRKQESDEIQNINEITQNEMHEETPFNNLLKKLEKLEIEKKARLNNEASGLNDQDGDCDLQNEIEREKGVLEEFIETDKKSRIEYTPSPNDCHEELLENFNQLVVEKKEDEELKKFSTKIVCEDRVLRIDSQSSEDCGFVVNSAQDSDGNEDGDKEEEYEKEDGDVKTMKKKVHRAYLRRGPLRNDKSKSTTASIHPYKISDPQMHYGRQVIVKTDFAKTDLPVLTYEDVKNLSGDEEYRLSQTNQPSLTYQSTQTHQMESPHETIDNSPGGPNLSLDVVLKQHIAESFGYSLNHPREASPISQQFGENSIKILAPNEEITLTENSVLSSQSPQQFGESTPPGMYQFTQTHQLSQTHQVAQTNQLTQTHQPSEPANLPDQYMCNLELHTPTQPNSVTVNCMYFPENLLDLDMNKEFNDVSENVGLELERYTPTPPSSVNSSFMYSPQNSSMERGGSMLEFLGNETIDNSPGGPNLSSIDQIGLESYMEIFKNSPIHRREVFEDLSGNFNLELEKLKSATASIHPYEISDPQMHYGRQVIVKTDFAKIDPPVLTHEDVSYKLPTQPNSVTVNCMYSPQNLSMESPHETIDNSPGEPNCTPGTVYKNLKNYKDRQKELAKLFAKMECCQLILKPFKEIFREKLHKLSKEKRNWLCLSVASLELKFAYSVLIHTLRDLSKSDKEEELKEALFCLVCNKVLSEQKTLFVEEFGLSLLRFAVLQCYQRPVITRYLVECVRLVTRSDEYKRTGDIVFTEVDSLGDNLLIACVRAGDRCANVLRELVRAEEHDVPLFDVHHVNTDGYTALHECCAKHSASAPRVHSLHVLLQHAAADRCKQDRKGGETPLHLAVNSANCELDMILIYFHNVDRSEWFQLAHVENSSQKNPLQDAKSAKKSRPNYPREILDFLQRCRK
ncbi:uncharacterized protein LOC112050699 [Bicyclus anynana]|uniref:Uncharacterized protein LOC112050699 n=1 Tax=Bicyclus anynana TaxID=110368 RepID=A0A6J1NIH8_BICAN|nr:uncharacterized protein LOC112050699 [Bicyclus anynana]XP_052746403.1 uncharacterized protein LOC112050699 [Bicyclus anynana]